MLSSSVLAARMNQARQRRMGIPHKCVRLAALDQCGKPVQKDGGQRVATGFLLRHSDGLYLYTCWHFVTGLDWHTPVLPVVGTQRTCSLVMTIQDAVPESASGMEGIGGRRDMPIPLYDTSTTPWHPLWEQERSTRSDTGTECDGLYVPHSFDVVRIRLPESGPFLSEQLQAFCEQNIWRDLVATGDKVRIAGFPYGFQSRIEHTQGLVFTRHAAQMGFSHQRDGAYLDAPCAPGVSGGPVLMEMGDHIFLVGIYTGSRFPDGANGNRNTALGTYCPLSLTMTNKDGDFGPCPLPA